MFSAKLVQRLAVASLSLFPVFVIETKIQQMLDKLLEQKTTTEQKIQENFRRHTQKKTQYL